MTFGLVGFFGMNYVLFWFCQNTVGVQLPFANMFFAFALSRLLTGVTVPPGAWASRRPGSPRFSSGGARTLRRPRPASSSTRSMCTSSRSRYVHFLEVPLGALGWLAWWLGPKVGPIQPQGGSSSTTNGTNT